MSMELEGIAELEKALATLGERTQRKVVRQAVNRSLTPVAKAARENAPQESGLLAKSISKKVKTYVESQTVVGLVGPDTETQGEFNGEKRWPAKYAHLVENGHIGPHGETVPAHPFLRPALDSNQSQMLSTMADRIGKGVEREAAKLS